MIREQLQKRIQERAEQYVSDLTENREPCSKVMRKRELFQKRSANILKVHAKGCVREMESVQEDSIIQYDVHVQYFIKQSDFYYIEEEIEQRIAIFREGQLVEDNELVEETPPLQFVPKDEQEAVERIAYRYNRLKAVQYAEKWWNSYNPAYKKFDVDCTNFISQCVHAGGAPMRGHPNRTKGWWMRGNSWSYSWTVANAFRLYLNGSTIGLRAKEVSSPEQLLLGDVICYDFQGNGRYDHSTIVTAKDNNHQPLVNAHTTNSRMRFWSYEDSTAYTPNIRYKFFTIMDNG